MSPPGYRYGAWDGGPDPLASPFDVADAVDEIGDAVLAGRTPRDAIEELLRRGLAGRAGDPGRQRRRGLDELRRAVERRRAQVRDRGRLDGTLEQVRALLDKAIGQERAQLFPDPSDDARMREAELDTLPAETSRAVQALSDYEWRSPQARQTFEQIQDLLRREVLDSQFRGMKQALENASPADVARVKEMLAALNEMLERAARGEDTEAQFADFMAQFGDFFPGNPQNLDELVDELARRAAAAQRLMRSLTSQQRAELQALSAGILGEAGLADQMARLQDALRSARPDLDWGSPGRGRDRMTGGDPLGMGDATTALEELAELDELATTLNQGYAGATLDDIDPEAVARALGREAVDDLRVLQQIERELERQGYVDRREGRMELTPRAIRRIGLRALTRVFSDIDTRGRGDHDTRDAGAAGELTGSSRAWQFGDEQPLDVIRTVRNAVLRSAGVPGRRVRLAVEDFEVVETERRASAAVCLLVDLSYSMALRGTWGVAKSTALALHSLITTQFPQDAIHLIGFSEYARELRPTELPALDSEMVQGTNLQHALLLARRRLAKYPDSEPVVLVVTDGEPTAHLLSDGSPWFTWPPLPETLELTLAEVDRLTRAGATINVFMLDDEPRLVEFVEEVARRNGGRVFSPSPERLGQYVVRDYLRARHGRRATANRAARP
jgi:uncharacterized protein with von Willebrand factor type A (vWA) domain